MVALAQPAGGVEPLDAGDVPFHDGDPVGRRLGVKQIREQPGVGPRREAGGSRGGVSAEDRLVTVGHEDVEPCATGEQRCREPGDATSTMRASLCRRSSVVSSAVGSVSDSLMAG
jgi:hypothetical protein